jgi:hypothetical protein
MENEHLVTLEKVCDHYRVEISFIQSLNDYGLIEISRVDEVDCIHEDYLADLQRIINLHYELNINMEGIDAITNLLRKVKEMQQELIFLKNKLEKE